MTHVAGKIEDILNKPKYHRLMFQTVIVLNTNIKP